MPTRTAIADPRAQLRAMWSSVAPAWEARARETDARGAALAALMIDRCALRPGDRVLELACGAGGLGLLAAERAGPGGEVVVTDLVPEMAAIAAVRAAERGLGNVVVRERDVERIDEPDACFDVVLCGEGLMLVPDPARGLREVHRVLRPGGRAAVAVWGPRADNPWLGAVFDAVTAVTGAPVPPPGIPGPFSLDDPDRLACLMRDARLADVRVEEVPVPLRAGSVRDWWERASALAGPLARRLALLPRDVRDAARARARAAAADHIAPDGSLEIPGVALLASARRP